MQDFDRSELRERSERPYDLEADVSTAWVQKARTGSYEKSFQVLL